MDIFKYFFIPMVIHHDTEDLYVRSNSNLYLAKGSSSNSLKENSSSSSSSGINSGTNSPLEKGVTPYVKEAVFSHFQGKKVLDKFYTNYLGKFDQILSNVQNINDIKHNVNYEAISNPNNQTGEDKDLDFNSLLKRYAQMHILHFELRVLFIKDLIPLLPENNKAEVLKLLKDYSDSNTKYNKDVNNIKLSKKSPNNLKPVLKQFFDLNNTYKKNSTQKLAMADQIIMANIKRNFFYENSPKFKNLLNKDYPCLVKSFKDQSKDASKFINESLNKSENK